MADNTQYPSKSGAKLATGAKYEQPQIIDNKHIKHVTLEPAGIAEPTDDQVLWGVIRERTGALSFKAYETFIEAVFCGGKGVPPPGAPEALTEKGILPLSDTKCYHGQEAYNILRAATEVFVTLGCGTHPKDKEPILLKKFLTTNTTAQVLPYLDRILDALHLNDLTDQAKSPLCDGVLRPQLDDKDSCYPCLLELIWSYWHEEGMLVQALNAICLRFQNKRSPKLRDPLANLRLDPLRPLNTLLWGYIQDEINRLTVARRAYEYDHEYGLRLVGKAVSDMETVDSRSKFLEAFHNLLYVTGRFYKEADDMTVKADAFPVLNALRELHLILAQGAHNQFGDLPWTARVEMLIQKWLLSRTEIREFLGGSPMIPYKESWMGHVDAMKTIQGWSDVSVSHYRDLAVYGEQILLSVRWNDWIDDDFTQANAYNWAISWRPEIQSYIHSYRAVTGVDISSEVTDTRSAAERNLQPAFHQIRRLNSLRRNGEESPRRQARNRVNEGNGEGVIYSR